MESEIRESDAVLVARAKDGEREAFGALVRRYQKVVCAIAYSRIREAESAQDIAQDAFLAGLENLSKLRTGSRFGSWIRSTTHRLCSQWQRSEMYRRALKARLRRGPASGGGATPVEVLEGRETRALLKEAIGKLPERLREALVLYYFEDQSQAEAAKRLGISEDAVQKRVARAKLRLRESVAAEIERELPLAAPDSGFAKRTLAAIPVGSICGKLGLNVTRLGLQEALRELAQKAAGRAPRALSGGAEIMSKKVMVAATVATLIILAAGGTGYVVTRHVRGQLGEGARGVSGESPSEVVSTGGEEGIEGDGFEASKGGEWKSGSAETAEKLDAEWLMGEVGKWSPGWMDRIAPSFLEDPKNAFNLYVLAAAFLVPTSDPRFEQLEEFLHSKEEWWKDPAKVAMVEEYLAANAQALELLKAGIEEAEYYQSPPIVGAETTLPYLAKFRELARLLGWEAKVFQAEGDMESALDDSLAALKMGMSVRSETIIIENLVGVAIAAIGGGALGACFPEVRDADACAYVIERLGRIREEELGSSGVIRRDIELITRDLADPEAARQVAREFGDDAWLRLSELPEEELRQQMERLRGILMPLAEAAELPYAEFMAATERDIPYDAVLGGIPKSEWDSRRRLVQSMYRARAQVSGYQILAGLKLYQLQTVTFPGSLGELVPGYLPALPEDPFSGEAFKYVRTGEGATVYSVGPDMVDNLGEERVRMDGGITEGDYVFAIR